MTAPTSIQGAGVQTYFPDTVLERLKPGYGSLDIERATLSLQPFDGQNNVAVARALASNVAMAITEQGTLLPENFPTKILPGSVERRVRAISPITAIVELRWTIGHAHPQVYCLNPRIDIRQDKDIPHVYVMRHPTEDVNAICPYPPHYGLFDPTTMDGQYHLVHATATWIANYLIWKATRRWVGPQASHSMPLIQAQFGEGSCWCRSGRPMALCCGRRLPLRGRA